MLQPAGPYQYSPQLEDAQEIRLLTVLPGTPSSTIRDNINTTRFEETDICVNPQDLVERSQQVKRIANIYSKARRVVVWLGPESHDTSITIECLTIIHSNIDVD